MSLSIIGKMATSSDRFFFPFNSKEILIEIYYFYFNVVALLLFSNCHFTIYQKILNAQKFVSVVTHTVIAMGLFRILFSFIASAFLSSGYSVAIPTEDTKLQHIQLGKFHISINTFEPFIQIVVNTEDNIDRVVFKSLVHWPFLTVGYSTESNHPIVDGNYNVDEWTLFETPYQSISSVSYDADIRQLVISGDMWGSVTKASYDLTFYIPEQSSSPSSSVIQFEENQLAFKVKASSVSGRFNRIFLNYWCDDQESFYGFGAQVAYCILYA
jgi:hypothetical protein